MFHEPFDVSLLFFKYLGFEIHGIKPLRVILSIFSLRLFILLVVINQASALSGDGACFLFFLILTWVVELLDLIVSSLVDEKFLVALNA